MWTLRSLWLQYFSKLLSSALDVWLGPFSFRLFPFELFSRHQKREEKLFHAWIFICVSFHPKKFLFPALGPSKPVFIAQGGPTEAQFILCQVLCTSFWSNTGPSLGLDWPELVATRLTRLPHNQEVAGLITNTFKSTPCLTNNVQWQCTQWKVDVGKLLLTVHLEKNGGKKK